MCVDTPVTRAHGLCSPFPSILLVAFIAKLNGFMKNWNVEKYTKRENLWNIQSKLSATEHENVHLLVLYPWRTWTLKFSRQIPVVRGPQQHRKIRRRIRSLEGCYEQRSLRTSTLETLDSSQNAWFFSNEAIGTVVARIRDVAIDPRNERRLSVSNFPARFSRVSRSAAGKNRSISCVRRLSARMRSLWTARTVSTYVWAAILCESVCYDTIIVFVGV